MTDVEDQLLIRRDDRAPAPQEFWDTATGDDCLRLAGVTSDDDDYDDDVTMRLPWFQYSYRYNQQLQLTPPMDTSSSSAHSDESLQVGSQARFHSVVS